MSVLRLPINSTENPYFWHHIKCRITCREFSEIYEKKISGFREQIRMYNAQIESIGADPDALFAWMEEFTEFDDPQELNRYLAVRTVDIEKYVLDIHLNHEDEYQKICKYVKEKETGIV